MVTDNVTLFEMLVWRKIDAAQIAGDTYKAKRPKVKRLHPGIESRHQHQTKRHGGVEGHATKGIESH